MQDPLIDPDALSSLASDYVQRMTSIRGRRIRRLVLREFAGAARVLLVVDVLSGAPTVLGVSASGAAFCATDGRGPHVTVVRWLHDSADGLETRFDLLKDSLPVIATRRMPPAELRDRTRFRRPADAHPLVVRDLLPPGEPGEPGEPVDRRRFGDASSSG